MSMGGEAMQFLVAAVCRWCSIASPFASPSAFLAALVLVCLATTDMSDCLAQMTRQTWPGRPAVTMQVGESLTRIPGETPAPFLVVDREETVSFALPPPDSNRTRYYPLVKRLGDREWIVQPPLQRREAGSEWLGFVRFGNDDDAGRIFHLQVIAANVRLPAGLLSDRLKDAHALPASSAPFTVQRRAAPAVAYLVRIGNQPVYSAARDYTIGADIEVQAVGQQLPLGYEIGLAVTPSDCVPASTWVVRRPGAGERPVFVPRFDSPQWRRCERFTMTLFIARSDQFPPTGRGISEAFWRQQSERFVFLSPGIAVARAAGRM